MSEAAIAVTEFDGLSEGARALLEGAVDVHTHAAPDPYTARRTDSRELVELAIEAGMGGLVLKSHDYATQPLAWALDREFSGLDVYGSLSLDHGLGGLNPDAVSVSLRIGARVVWMPTFDSASYRERGGRFFSAGQGIGLLDDSGALLPVCHDLLDVIAEHDAVLASGHLSSVETLALLTEARRRDIRSVITHASFGIDLEVQRELAGQGCFIEHCGLAAFRDDGGAAVRSIADQIRSVGLGQIVASTDLGQVNNPPPPLGMGIWIQCLLDEGFDARAVSQMVRENPRSLLGDPPGN